MQNSGWEPGAFLLFQHKGSEVPHSPKSKAAHFAQPLHNKLAASGWLKAGQDPLAKPLKMSLGLSHHTGRKTSGIFEESFYGYPHLD